MRIAVSGDLIEIVANTYRENVFVGLLGSLENTVLVHKVSCHRTGMSHTEMKTILSIYKMV